MHRRPTGKEENTVGVEGFMFELCYTGVSGADVSDLDDSWQTGGTIGQAPHHPVYIDKGFTCDDILTPLKHKNVCGYESCH
jgi:hypothetical protein